MSRYGSASGSSGRRRSVSSGVPKILGTHYFPPYPPSFRGTAGTTPPEVDTGQFYDDSYLVSGGAGSGTYGSLLRDRPLPAAVLPTSYANTLTGRYAAFVEDQKAELAAMKAMGLNTSWLELLSYDNFADRNYQIARAHRDAANAVGGIAVYPTPDMSGPLGSTTTAQTLATALLDLASSPGLGRIDGTNILFAPFTPETRNQQFWTDVDTALAAGGLTAYRWMWLVQDWSQLATWTARPKTWGMSAWGGRNPAFAVSERPRGAQAHAAGTKWIQNVAPQDARPSQGIYDEANGSQLLRENYQSARDSNADGTQLITFNDESECTQVQPTQKNGTGWGAVNRWYADWFTTGVKPTPTKDFVAILHRLHHTGAALPTGRTRMTLRGGSTATVNIVEVMTWLAADATVTATIGGIAQTPYTATAGEFIKVFPITASTSGTPSVVVSRGGSSVLTVTSRNAITTSPIQEDLTYYVTHGQAS